jgi:hypothetical protein
MRAAHDDQSYCARRERFPTADQGQLQRHKHSQENTINSSGISTIITVKSKK